MLRGEVEKCIADNERGGRVCALCHAPDHREEHHSFAAMDYAAQAGLLANPAPPQQTSQQQKPPKAAGAAAGAGQGGQPAAAPWAGQGGPPPPPPPAAPTKDAASIPCRWKGDCRRLRAGKCPNYHTPEEISQARAAQPTPGSAQSPNAAQPAPPNGAQANSQGTGQPGGKGKGKGRSPPFVPGICSTCGKARSEHPGGRYCGAGGGAAPTAAPAGAQPAPQGPASQIRAVQPASAPAASAAAAAKTAARPR